MGQSPWGGRVGYAGILIANSGQTTTLYSDRKTGDSRRRHSSEAGGEPILRESDCLVGGAQSLRPEGNVVPVEEDALRKLADSQSSGKAVSASTKQVPGSVNKGRPLGAKDKAPRKSGKDTTHRTPVLGLQVAL